MNLQMKLAIGIISAFLCIGGSLQLEVQPDCDDGMNNIFLDYKDEIYHYTCNEPAVLFEPQPLVNPLLITEEIPENFVPKSICGNRSIVYQTGIPTFGHHRGIMPQYGEYKYLPAQRWLNNLKYGGIVFLYHPCVLDRKQPDIKRFKQLLKSCLRNYIITADIEVTYDRPYALIAWGQLALFTSFDGPAMTKFIDTYANKGPITQTEHADAQYNHLLVEPSHYDFEIDGQDILCNRNAMPALKWGSV